MSDRMNGQDTGRLTYDSLTVRTRADCIRRRQPDREVRKDRIINQTGSVKGWGWQADKVTGDMKTAGQDMTGFESSRLSLLQIAGMLRWWHFCPCISETSIKEGKHMNIFKEEN
jgi:hypothetical protein